MYTNRQTPLCTIDAPLRECQYNVDISSTPVHACCLYPIGLWFNH